MSEAKPCDKTLRTCDYKKAFCLKEFKHKFTQKLMKERLNVLIKP